MELSIAERSKLTTFSCFIDPSVWIGEDCMIGPNVYIGKSVKIGHGVKIKNSIILAGTEILGYSLISNSIIGWNCKIGAWARIEGDS